MMRKKIYSYNLGSVGCQVLAKDLGISILKHEGSQFRPRKGDVIINWGVHQNPFPRSEVHWINTPACVAIARNKLETFRLFQGKVSHPRWTTDIEEAKTWLKTKTVVSRQTLTGQAGAGIIISRKGDTSLPKALLYVEYIPKDQEFRVHTIGGNVLDVQRKIRDPEREPTDWKVRSHANGFIFARNNVQPPKPVLDVSLLATSIVGLDFAAVDVIWNEKSQTAYVLELNTAPGLEGQTVKSYVTGLSTLIREKYNG